MQLKTILNRVAKQPGFVFVACQLVSVCGRLELHVRVRARKASRGVCSGCFVRRPGYDRLPERLYQFVPLWNIAVFWKSRKPFRNLLADAL